MSYREDYNVDGSLSAESIGRLVRFTGDGQVGLATAPGSEVGILFLFYGDGRGCVLQSGGPEQVVAGVDLNPGDRITSDGQGRAVTGGNFGIVSKGATAGQLATVTLTAVPQFPSIEIDGPKTSDGKNIFLPNMFPGGVILYVAGSGDDVPNAELGEGQLFQASTSADGNTDVVFQFKDCIYFAGGAVKWEGGKVGDWLKLRVYAPATPVVPNLSNTGNANVGGGVIVPAAGNGAYDVDLSRACPLPAFDDDGVKSGYWDYSAPDMSMGAVVPALPGQGNCHLLAVERLLGMFVSKLPLLGTGLFNMTVPAIKPKLMWPQWTYKVTVHNEGGAHQLDVGWHLITARYDVT